MIVPPRFAPDRSEFDRCTCHEDADGEAVVCVGCKDFNLAHAEWYDAREKFIAAEESRGDYERDQMKDDEIERGDR